MPAIFVALFVTIVLLADLTRRRPHAIRLRSRRLSERTGRGRTAGRTLIP